MNYRIRTKNVNYHAVLLSCRYIQIVKMARAICNFTKSRNGLALMWLIL